MAVKAPIFYRKRRGPETGAGILDGEILSEMASAIGRAGRGMEKALADLKEHDAQQSDADTDQRRLELVQKAADRAWALFVQYDMAGLSSQAQLVKRYAIPAEVLVRVGIR
ncbi:DUF6665 family protein [Hoeflea poritis]|uniref:Uncharacterized protein n=1 Tax=Hoeflea poritis TaxID=2993659 RepID=A0ABT4VQM8_9HYPH|nr:DUF6665 family protein [Hoeflea poritis]MDA4846397.1 hypothetical protein [Hoeflea poritis]